MGKTLLVAVESHSKWPEVLEMNTTSASKDSYSVEGEVCMLQAARASCD